MNQQPLPSIKTCQIIAAALIMGVLMFAVVAISIQSGKEDVAPPDELPILLVIAIVFTVMELGVRQVLLLVFDNKLKQLLANDDQASDTAQQILGLYQTRLIISMALLEGAAFFGIVVYLVEGHWGGLGLAGFLLMFMAFTFPNENKFREWVRASSGQSAYAGEE